MRSLFTFALIATVLSLPLATANSPRQLLSTASRNCSSTAPRSDCTVDSMLTRCGCIHKLDVPPGLSNSDTLDYDFVYPNATQKLTTMTVWADGSAIKLFQFNDDPSFPALANSKGLTDLGSFSIMYPVTSLTFYYDTSSSCKGTIFAMRMSFNNLTPDQFVAYDKSLSQTQISAGIDRLVSNSTLENTTYTFANEFIGFKTYFPTATSVTCYKSIWQLDVVDQSRSSDTFLTMPTVSINTTNAKFLINDNRTTASVNTNFPIVNATQNTWSDCGKILYSISVTSNAIQHNGSLVDYKNFTKTNNYKNKVQFFSSFDEFEAGLYTIVLSAFFDQNPPKTVSTTVSALYQSCLSNTLIPSFTTPIPDISTTVSGSEVCITLPTWTDQFSSDYNSPLVCGDIVLQSVYIWYTNNTNASTSLISNSYSAISQTSLCIKATSDSQVTKWVANDYIQVVIVPKLSNYSKVTSSVSFRLNIDWCNYQSEQAPSINISFNGAASVSSTQSSFTATSTTFTMAVTFPQVTSLCYYTITPTQLKVTENSIVTSISSPGGSYTIATANNKCGNPKLQINTLWDIALHDTNKSLSLADYSNPYFYVNYIIPTSITGKQMYAGGFGTFDISNFTTSFGDSDCVGFTYTSKIVNSDGSVTTMTTSLGTSTSPGSFQITCTSNSYSDLGVKLVTVTGYSTIDITQSASYTFNLTVLDSCNLAEFVELNNKQIPATSQKIQTDMTVELGNTVTKQLDGNYDNVSFALGSGNLTKYCDRLYKLVSATCKSGSTCTSNIDPAKFFIDSSTKSVRIDPFALDKSLIGIHSVILSEQLVMNIITNPSTNLIFNLQVSCTLTSYTLTSLANQTVTIYSGSTFSWTFPIANAVQSPSYCYYSQQLSFTANSTIVQSSQIAANQSISFSVAAITDYTVAGTYSVTVTSTISDAQTSVASTASTTFYVIVVDPCPSTVISNTSPFTAKTVYVLDSYLQTNLPIFIDSKSNASGNAALCGGISILINIVQPSTSTSVAWFSSNVASSPSYIVTNPSMVYPAIYSQVGTYTINVKATMTRYTSVTLSNSFLLNLVDPCDYTSVTQPTVAAINANWQTTYPPQSVTPVIPISLSSQTTNCTPISYSVSSAAQAGTSTTLATSNLYLSSSSASPIIYIDLTNNNLVGNYTGQLVYNLRSGGTVSLSFTIYISPCITTALSIGATLPTISDFILNYSPLTTVTIPLSITQTPACGYLYSLSYTVNGITNPSSPNNLAADLTNQSSVVFTLSPTSNGLNFGVHSVSLIATTVIPSTYTTPNMSSSVTFNQAIKVDCSILVPDDIFVPSTLPTTLTNVYIGNYSTKIYFTNYTDTMSNAIGIPNACGYIQYRYLLNDVNFTNAPSITTNLTYGLPSPNQNLISIGSLTCCITPASQTAIVQAFIEGTRFVSSNKSFSVLFIDPCQTAVISMTTLIANMATTVLASTSQTILTFFTDNVTQYYKLTSSYTCGAYTFGLTSTPVSTSVTSLDSSLGINSSTGQITLSPTLVGQVGNHTLTLSVSITLSDTTKVTKNFLFTAIIDYCVVTSYSMVLSPLVLEYNLTWPAPAPFTFSNSNWQTPACGYSQSFTHSISPALPFLTGSKPADYGDYSFSIVQNNTRSYAGIYTIILTSAVVGYNHTSTAPTTTTSIKVVIYDACRDSKPTLNQTLPIGNLSIYTWGWDASSQTQINNTLYTPVTAFHDVVSESQNNLSYCGGQTYTAVLTPLVQSSFSVGIFNVVNSKFPELNIYSDQMNQAGSYVIGITSKLDSFPNNTLTVTFNLTVYNACYFSQVQVPTFPTLYSTVLAPNNVTSPSPASTPNDTVSVKFGNGTSSCGSRQFTISTDNTAFYPSNGISIDSFTGAVTLSPTTKNQIANITVTVNITLLQFTNITNTTTFQVQIWPCRILGVSMTQPANQTYTLSTNETWKMDYNRSSVIQSRTCDYSYSFNFTTSQSSLSQLITFQNSTDFTQVAFALSTTDRSLLYQNLKYDDRVFLVTLNVYLIECLDFIYCSKNLSATSDQSIGGKAYNSTTFYLTIKDPCKVTEVISKQVENLHSFAGYTVSSAIKYLFSDSVTVLFNIPLYCGNFNLTCNYTASPNTSVAEMSVVNGEFFYFSPLAQASIFGSQDVTLTAYLVQYYPNVFVNQTFSITTLGYSDPQIPDQVYYVNSSAIIYKSSPFSVLPNGLTFEDMSASKLQLYSIAYTDYARIPLNLTLLNAVDFNNSNVIKWLSLDISGNGTVTFKIETNDSKLVNTVHKFVLVQNYPKLGQSLYGQFSVYIQKIAVMKKVIPPPDFATPLEDQNVTYDADPSFRWSYQLPKGESSTPGVTISQITCNCGTESLKYVQNLRTIQQVKPISSSLRVTCVLTLTDSWGNQNKKSLSVSFIVNRSGNFSVGDSLAFLNVSKTKVIQTSFPGATISNIDKSGLLTIEFNITMKVPDHPTEIQNGTVSINGTVLPTLQVDVIPSKQSNISSLNFTWTYVDFSKQSLKIQLSFDHPNYVSTQKDKDQIKITIYGKYLFADFRGNMIPQETVLMKSLPKQSVKSMADKMQSLGIDTSNGVLCVLFTNTLMTVMVAGPINLILGAVKQLQTTSHLMLINVPTPANLNIFFAILMQLVTLNFIDTTKFVDKTMKLDQVNPFTEQFNEVGYGSLYIFQNLGTMAFIMFGLPPLLGVVYLLIKVSKLQNLESYKKKISNFLCYDGTISFLYETILLIAICGMLNQSYFHLNSVGNAINSVICVFFLGTCAVFPIFVAVFYSHPSIYKQIENRSAGFKERFGGILEGLNFLRQGKQVIIYLIFTLVRKIILAGTCVYLIHYPLFSIFSQIVVSVAMIIMLGYVEPLSDKISNKIELFNESCVLIHLYHSLCFTDWQPDLNWRDTTGTSLVVATGGNIVVNLVLVSIITLSVLARKLKIHYLKTKQRLAIDKKLKIKRLAEARVLRETLRLQQEAENKLNLQKWEEKLQMEKQAMEKALLQQQVLVERKKIEKAMLEQQAKEKKLQEKQAQEARKRELLNNAFDARGFPVKPPIDLSLYTKQNQQHQESAQKLINPKQNEELVYPVQAPQKSLQKLHAPQKYDFNKNSVAQLEFTQPKYKPKIQNQEQQKPETLEQQTERKERDDWDRAHPEEARQRDELIKASARWTRYQPGHYKFMDEQPPITDPRFIGPGM